MTLTVTQAFDLPRADQITALGFVIQLAEGAEADTRRLVGDYVLTPHVREALGGILGTMRATQARGEEHGRFIHGSFGSGKSHFMSFLGLLLEDDAIAWSKDDPLIRDLGATHRPWLGDASLLVVRIHMLTMNQPGWGLDRVIYESFNKALRRRDKPAFEFLHTEGILAEARQEAERYGDVFWRNMELAGICDSQAMFDELAQGSPRDREDLARAYLEYKGRDPASAGMDPNWAEGLQRMARHARDHGFGGVVLLIDELLLWLGAKDARAFTKAINDLVVIVDHADGQRAVPVHVFVARQRNLREFFPDMASEDQLHEYLDHHSKRFELTTLEDVELRHICRERVLKRREHEAVERCLDSLTERHAKILPLILQHADADYLRDVYPFHPALIEMLIDISNLMQRDRTALRLLYELLVIHYPDLPLGELLPVGSAFEAVFAPSGVEGNRRVDDLKAVHGLYYQRFRPAIAELQREMTEDQVGSADRRARALDQLVKTALLAAVSPRLRGTSGVTLERLVRLNDADVVGELDRAKIATAYQDLVSLSQKVPALQLTGQGKGAVVGVVLRGVNFGEVLDRARARTDNRHARFQTFYRTLKLALGLARESGGQLAYDKGFGEGDKNDGPLRVSWRGTKRNGSLALANVRELSYAAFKPPPGEAFRLLVDYPWDEAGHTVQEDRSRANQVRRSEGSMPTLCWLPRHLTPAELATLRDLAACRFILTPAGQDELLANLGPHDRQQVIEQAASMATSMDNQLKATLQRAYKDHGEVIALLSDVDTAVPEPNLAANLERLAGRLLDRTYPNHPQFRAEPRPADLRSLLGWMIEAANTPDRRAPFDDATARVLRALGEPLELVTLGQSHGQLRLDTRYIKAVLDRTQDARASWDAIDDELHNHFGLDEAVRNLFLAFLVRAQGFRARYKLTREVVDVEVRSTPYAGLELERATLLEVSEWSALRVLARGLFGDDPLGPHRTLAAQDRAAKALRQLASEAREHLQALHAEVVGIVEPGGDAAATPRLAELKEAMARLKPLLGPDEDSHAPLAAFLAAWPGANEGADDPLQTVVRTARAHLDALGRLERTTKTHLEQVTAHPAHGEAVRACLARLTALVGGADAEHPLTTSAVGDWNAGAAALVARLIAAPPEPPPPTPPIGPTTTATRAAPTPTPPTPPAPPQPDGVLVMRGKALNPHDGDDLGAFIGELRAALRGLGHGAVEVDVTVRTKE